MAIRLHCFGESGNAYKAALGLELMDQKWEAVFVDFFNGETRTEAFRTLNPMGEVPVMECDHQVICQSGRILRHIARQSGRFCGDEEDVLAWLLWDNHKFSTVCGSLRFLSNFLPSDRRPEQVIHWLEKRMGESLRVLETVLVKRDWVAGPEPTIADLSCCGYLYYPESFGFCREDWPHIDGWLNRIASLPGWQHPYDLMPRAMT